MSSKARQNITGYLFIAPNMIGFTFFLLIPVLFSLVISFTSWDMVSGISGVKFTGLRNYINLASDTFFIKSCINNIIYTLAFVPSTMFFALILAVIMNRNIWGRKALRTAFFIPFVTNIVAVSVVWIAMFQPEAGPINQFLHSIGMKNTPMWLASSDTVMYSIITVNVWMNLGYTMVIYLAGLQNIPKDLYEAATIDGAGVFQQFFKITIPMLSPTTFFILITTIIHSFKVFGTVNVMTQGGPGDASSVIVFDIYTTAFRYYKMGYASSMAWVLFIVIFLVTILQWRGQRKWVNYSL